MSFAQVKVAKETSFKNLKKLTDPKLLNGHYNCISK